MSEAFRQPDDTVGVAEVEQLYQRIADLEAALHAREQELDALRQYEEHFRIVADFTYDWEYWLDPAGVLRYVSPACERITGYPPAAFLADAALLERIVHPADRPRLTQHLHQCREQRIAELVFRIITRAGEERWIAHACQPVYDAAGHWLGQRASNRDITEQHEAQEAYRLLVEHSLQALAIFQDGHNVFVNPAAARLTGYSQEELLAMTPAEANQVVYPDDRAMLAERARARQRGEDVPPRYEFRLIRKDGAVRWMECYNTRCTYQGQPAVQMTYIDITERKHAEAALHASETRFRSLFRFAPLGIILSDAQGCCLESNPAMQQMLGYSEAELRGMSFAAFTQPDDLAAELALIDELRSGQRNEYHLQKRYVRKDGELVWVTVHATAFMGAASGERYGLAIAEDITERRQIETALRESEARYRALVESSADAIFQIDRAGYYRFINPAGSAALGGPPTTIIGHHLYDLMTTEGADATLSMLNEVIQTGEPLHVEHPLKLNSMRAIYSTHLVPMFDSTGSVSSVMGIGRDMTRFREAEHALRESQTRLQAIFDNAAVGMGLLDTQWRYIAINDRWAEMLGLERDAVYQGSVLDVTHPEDIDRSDTHQQALARGELDHYRLEKRFVRGDSSTFWGDVSVTLVRDAQGQPDAIIGVVNDITERKLAEEALRASEELIQSITNSAPYIIYLYDLARGHNTYINAYGQAFFDCTLEEMEQQGEAFFVELLHPDDWAAMADYRQQWPTASDGQVFMKEYRLKNAAGQWRWLRSYEVVFRRGPDGLPRELMGTAIDITEHKQAQKALATSEARYEQAVRAGRVGIWEWNLETNEIYVAPNLKGLLGYADHEIRNELTDWGSYVHPDDQQAVMRAAEACIQGEAEVYELEHRMLHKDGSIRWIAVRGTVTRDAAGTPIRMAGTDTDITERKQAEEALQSSEAQLQAIFDNAAVGIALVSPDGCWLDLNRRGLDMLGYTLDELRDMTYLDITHPEHRALSAEYMAGLLRNDYQHYRIEKRYIRKDGSMFWADLAVTAIRNKQGAVEMCVGVLTDITERKHAEEQLHALNERLRQQAIQDALTGLHNRRYLDEMLPHELQRATRYEYSVGVIMLDIDHFKHFNDTYGHDTGDMLLRAVGAFLRQHTRGHDIACRYGGEEFTLVLPGASLDDTQRRAEQVRLGIKALRVQQNGQPLEAVTVSLGVAAFPLHSHEADELVKRADSALYRAKAAGRDCVFVARAAQPNHFD